MHTNVSIAKLLLALTLGFGSLASAAPTGRPELAAAMAADSVASDPEPVLVRDAININPEPVL